MKNFKNIIFATIVGAFLLLYFSGPSPEKPLLDPTMPQLPISVNNAEDFVKKQESEQFTIKPDNQARIIWADSVNKSKTPYSIVYLHGYAASQGEGDPVHKEFAKRYGCNLYLSRLSDHGLNEKEPLLNLTPEKLLASAKEAVAIGKVLGEKVILMSTSTGGTLSLIIASGNPDIHALIMYSPNIDLYDNKSWLLSQPWGLQIARLVMGGKYYSFNGPPGAEKYWNMKYRLEAVVNLKSLLNAGMNKETFNKVTQPVFLGYYYKDENHQDDVVSVKSMLEMYDNLGTDSTKKRKISFPEAGTHIIASKLWSKDVDGVESETYKFAEEVLGMKPQ